MEPRRTSATVTPLVRQPPDVETPASSPVVQAGSKVVMGWALMFVGILTICGLLGLLLGLQTGIVFFVLTMAVIAIIAGGVLAFDKYAG